MGESPATIPLIKPYWLNDSFPEPLHLHLCSQNFTTGFCFSFYALYGAVRSF